MLTTKREMAFEIYARLVAQTLYVDYDHAGATTPVVTPGQQKCYPELVRLAFAAADAFEKAAGL